MALRRGRGRLTRLYEEAALVDTREELEESEFFKVGQSNDSLSCSSCCASVSRMVSRMEIDEEAP